jgi:hypothetical protein
MQTIFGCGVATSRFAMGSNEVLGQPSTEQETIDVDNDAPAHAKEDPSASKDEEKAEEKKKRKRVLSEEDVATMTAMIDAI